MTSHIAAFLIIFNQASYHLLSPHDVNILNHAYIISTTATVANMARAQLIAFAIVSSNESLGLSFDFIKSKPGMSLKRSLQNQPSCAKVIVGTKLNNATLSQTKVSNQYNIFFIMVFSFINLLCSFTICHISLLCILFKKPEYNTNNQPRQSNNCDTNCSILKNS
jgi:hypothetical protein